MLGNRANFFSIQTVRQEHMGHCTCIATNIAGSDAFAADLHVNST
jgi:hypothetical protein